MTFVWTNTGKMPPLLPAPCLMLCPFHWSIETPPTVTWSVGAEFMESATDYSVSQKLVFHKLTYVDNSSLMDSRWTSLNVLECPERPLWLLGNRLPALWFFFEKTFSPAAARWQMMCYFSTLPSHPDSRCVKNDPSSSWTRSRTALWK